jgi:hypothetical protein
MKISVGPGPQDLVIDVDRDRGRVEELVLDGYVDDRGLRSERACERPASQTIQGQLHELL